MSILVVGTVAFDAIETPFGIQKVKVEIDERSVDQPRNSHGDVLFFFSLGSLATVFAASLGYMIFSFVL